MYFLLHIGAAFVGEWYYSRKQRNRRKKLKNKWNFIPKVTNWLYLVVDQSNVINDDHRTGYDAQINYHKRRFEKIKY